MDVKIIPLGTTRLNNTLYGITITDNAKNPKINSWERKNVLIIARCRPSDCWSSFLSEDLIYLLMNDTNSKKMFKFHIVPMINPDGVILGNSRCNLSGRDLT